LFAKLTSDFDSTLAGKSASEYCLLGLLVEKLSRGIRGLLQQYRPFCDIMMVADNGRFRPGEQKHVHDLAMLVYEFTL